MSDTLLVKNGVYSLCLTFYWPHTGAHLPPAGAAAWSGRPRPRGLHAVCGAGGAAAVLARRRGG